MFELAQEYFKLEKVEIAGLRGGKLGPMVFEIYENFTKRYNDFANVSYEMLLPEDSGFDVDLKSFLDMVSVC